MGYARDFIKKNNLSNVTLVGSVKPDEVSAYLKQHTFYIFPTTGDEGMPYSLLEAMSCGLICMASDHSGANLVIESGVNGYIIKKPLQEELVKKILFFIDEVELEELQRISQNAHITIEESYNVKNQLKLLDDMLIEAGGE